MKLAHTYPNSIILYTVSGSEFAALVNLQLPEVARHRLQAGR